MDHPHKGLGGVEGEMRNETFLAENCLFCNIYTQALLFCVFSCIKDLFIRGHVSDHKRNVLGYFLGSRSGCFSLTESSFLGVAF